MKPRPTAGRLRPRDWAAVGLGVLCLVAAAGLALHLVINLAAALIPVLVPFILIAVAILALLGLRR